jgi:3-oxoacyl-[acyl-carrier protein] reductase
MTKVLADHTALVTGASRNIGRAIAVELAQMGAHVVVHVNCDKAAAAETVAEVEAAGGTATIVSGDLSDPDTAARVVAEAAAANGRLDIIVNNAAIRPEASFSALEFSEWKLVMGVNLDAVFLVCKAALPHLEKSPNAAIVSLGGLTGSSGAQGRAHVVTSKAAIIGLTKAMAHDLGSMGITANCVSPGLIDTERKAQGGAAPKHHDSRTNLVGRRGHAQEVAEAVAFLCSPKARYITGETMHVNGGAYLS